jgi:hypothetical protein
MLDKSDPYPISPLAEIDFALKESSFSRNLASVVLGLLSNPLKILGMEMPPPGSNRGLFIERLGSAYSRLDQFYDLRPAGWLT